MTHVAGKNGGVYGNALLVEDAEDAWTTGGAGRAVSTTAGKVGTNAARVTTTAIGATTLLQYEAIVKDLTAYDAIYFWARSSLTTASGDLQLLLDESADCLSPEESLHIPALTANTWKQCFALMTDPSVLNSVVAVGLYQVVDLADGTFDIDDVEALAEIDGVRAWTLDYTVATLDVTDFASSGTRDILPGGSQWAGTFEGLKDGVPLSIGSEVYLVLGESNTAYQGWVGKVVITGAHPNVSADGLVTYSYDYEGTGDLQPPSA